jgi:methionyl aminopeptidase
MDDKELENFKEAGKIAAKVREDSKRLIMIGEPLLDIAETIEQMVIDEGARLAFPVNISINEIAAHYTPELECKRILQENDLVKIDIGVELNSAISDTAYTIDLSGKNDLVKAAEDGLAIAIKNIKPGVTVGEIGGLIEDTIKAAGFKPISNLSGHMIKSGVLHAGVNIPNVRSNDPYKFQVGDVFAVEPFATTGEGFVNDTDQVEIFSLYAPHPVRMRQSRKILQWIIEKYQLMPFAERWIRKAFTSKMLVSVALRELLSNGIIRGYPVLKEAGDGLVAQAEHTVLVEEKGVRVLTQ